jgi:FHS family L-fucose permease-like MFS transporter
MQRVASNPLAVGRSHTFKPQPRTVMVSSQRPAPLLWVMFLAYFTFGLMGVLGALTPDIIKDFHLTSTTAALFGSAYLMALAVFAIPAGLLADRVGARRVILWGVGLMTLACVMVSRSHSYMVILCMVFALGVGITMLQTAGSPTVQELDAPKNYSRNLTYTIACCTIGAFISIFMLAYIRGTGRSWKDYYLLFGGVCFVLLLLLALSHFPAHARSGEGIHLNQIGRLLKNPVLVAYILGIYLYTPAEYGTYYWIPKFFQDVHHVPAAVVNAGAASFLGRVFPSLPALVYAMFFGMQGVGRLLGGVVLKWLGTRLVLRVCSGGALVSLLVATMGSKPLTIAGFLACGFFTSVIFPLLFSGTINSCPELHGTISGVLCTSYVVAAAALPLQGWVGDHIGMRTAMLIPAVCMVYVVGLAIFGRAKYDEQAGC